jgi:hypothetical protein
VPRILTADQKHQRVDVCTQPCQLAFNDETPDLAPCDFFLLPKMKLKLKGRQFDTTEEIQAELQIVLPFLEHFQEVFQKWRRRWDWYAGGNYFKGDGS